MKFQVSWLRPNGQYVEEVFESPPNQITMTPLGPVIQSMTGQLVLAARTDSAEIRRLD